MPYAFELFWINQTNMFQFELVLIDNYNAVFSMFNEGV